jgi:cytochrome P450
MDVDRLEPPMPPPAPDNITGLGMLFALRRNALSAFPLRCLDQAVTHRRLPGRDLVVVTGRAAIRDVLQARAEDYTRVPAGRRVLGPIVGRGLLVSEGQRWRTQRRAMAPAFTPRTLPLMLPPIARVADATVAALRRQAGGPGDAGVDVLRTMQAASLEIAATVMFSLRSAAFGAELGRLVTGYMAGLGRPAPQDFVLPRWAPTPLAIRRALFRRRWLTLVRAIVASRPPRAADAPRDLFDLLAAAHGDDAEDLLLDEVATMLVAGHETTALALFWSVLMLARSPRWQDAVRREAAALDLSPDGAEHALPRLRAARAVVQETLRLFSPAFMTARLARRDTVAGGARVAAGSLVLAPFWLVHRDPARWPDPARFDPGRFLLGAEPDRYDYLPFGAGPHVCIGAQLALAEAVLVLARLAQAFAFHADPAERPVLPVAVLSTRPDHAPRLRLRPA